MYFMEVIKEINQKVLKKTKELCPALFTSSNKGIVLAVSGGTDSMVLLESFFSIATEMNWKLTVAHLNHCLRGQESLDDERYVIEQCKVKGINCITRQSDINSYATTNNLSVETAARTVRYDFLAEVCRDNNSNHIATAHHFDDNVETVLHRIIRGTGIKGLAGIKPIRKLSPESGKEIIVFRPLLNIPRRDLEDYITASNISPRFDSSNSNIEYTRNRIRNDLLPSLADSYNPNICSAIGNLSHIAADTDDILTELAIVDINSTAATLSPGYLSVKISHLESLSPGRSRNLLRFALEKIQAPLADIGYDSIDNIYNQLSDKNSRILAHLPGGFIAEISAHKLIIAANPANTTQTAITLPGITEITGLVWVNNLSRISQIKTSCVDMVNFDLNDYIKNKQPNQELINLDNISGNLSVAPLKTGLRYQPMGMSGTQTTGDIMTNHKVPRHQRNAIAAIYDEESIVCIPGLRISDAVKIDQNSKHGLLIEFIG